MSHPVSKIFNKTLTFLDQTVNYIQVFFEVIFTPDNILKHLFYEFYIVFIDLQHMSLLFQVFLFSFAIHILVYLNYERYV